MILVDPRGGSAGKDDSARKRAEEFVHLIRARGMESDLYALDAGDFAFEGNGPEGKIMVGIERKTISDMMNSIRSNRFTTIQSPLLHDAYPKAAYVFVEGIFMADTNGLLCVRRGNGWEPLQFGTGTFMYAEYDNFTTSMMEFTRLILKETATKNETVTRIVNLYRFWNDKEYHEHRSFKPTKIENHIEFRPWPWIRRAVKELPGIGAEGSGPLARAMKNLINMAFVSENEIAEMELPYGKRTRKIGKSQAKKIFEALHEDAH